MAVESPVSPKMAPQSIVNVKVVSIDLSPEEQALWLVFRRHHANLTTILESGALDIRNGTFVCHMDNDGNVRRIDRQDRLYSS